MEPAELARAWPGLEGGLEAADILLLHARRGALSTRIQRRSGSYWNHTAMVFKPKRELLIGGPLIVEASYSGIEIHQLKRYGDRLDQYDFGVKRFPGLTDAQRQKIVMSFILGNIDVSYDLSRLAAYFVSPIIRRLSSGLWEKFFRRFTHPDSFICTTFVDKAFHQFRSGKHRLVDEYVPTKDRRVGMMQMEEMITPADIAKDPAYEWVFNPRD